MNGLRASSARLLKQTRRSVGESWSLLRTLLPPVKKKAAGSSSETWRTKCLTLTQQDDNQVARTLLQLDKEVHLIRYHGIRKYIEEQQNKPSGEESLIVKWIHALSPLHWLRPYLSKAVEQQSNGGEVASSPSPSSNELLSNATSTTSKGSGTSNKVVKIPFVITTSMKQELAELGYSSPQMKQLTPLHATLLLQHQISPADKEQRLPTLIQQHEQALEQEHQRTLEEEEQQQQQQQQQQRKEFPQQHSSPPQSSTTIPNEPQQKQQQQTANDENEELLQLAANPQAESQSSSPPQATTPIHLHQQPTPTTTPRQKVTFDNDGWYRVIEVLKLPVHDEATGDETDELREEEIVASLHKTMDDAQKDCDFRQQLANRNYQDRATGAISAKTPAFRVEAPTVSTTESPQ